MSSSAGRRQRRVAERLADKMGHHHAVMPDIQDGRYISVVVFQPGPDRDLLGEVWRDPGGPWHVNYRFRYYVDDKTFDSDDVKRGYSWTAPAGWDEERCVNALIAAIQEANADGFGDPSEMDVVAIKSDKADDYLAKMQDRPWFAGKLRGAADA